MKVEQIYTNCIAEAAYYITNNGEAAIIDPLRETEPYLKRLEEDGVKLKYIFETHFHADFVSGHLDLAQKTGATIVYGPLATPDYDIYMAKDNEDFRVGNLTLRLIHTPGHTMESSSLLLINEKGEKEALFSGDTLFLGDVGRPDLAIKSDLTKEDLAGILFDSLREKIMTLPDNIVVYPGHGAGSSCGKNLSKETVGTIGFEKENNYALRADMTKEEFVKEITHDLLPPPQYFPKNAMMNKSGYQSIDDVLERGNKGLSVSEFKEEIEKGAIVIDTRHQSKFLKQHIPNALFIGIDGNFAMWIGALVTDIKQNIVFVADEGREQEVVTRLARVGYDHAQGFLKGGFDSWLDAKENTSSIDTISASDFSELYNEDINPLDVRKNGEFDAQHVHNANHFPLDFIFDNLDSLDKDKTYYTYCAGGYRSVIAISILQPYGYKNLINVEGGFSAIEKQPKVQTTHYVCPSTLK